ncbi:ankyrin repeat-containing domain protein [Flagelloscypha sp. PMI_526]|nr:ankyrin repeat-containing domain protein [Flagelloscypha sp. PMI_526]
MPSWFDIQEFDVNPSTKCVVCVLNAVSAETCRLLRNYRPRGRQSPPCSIRQVLQATFADCEHLPPVKIQHEYFISAISGYANPVRVLMKELGNAFPKRSSVACVASIGTGRLSPQHLTNVTDSASLARLLQSSELVSNEFASQCHELGPFFFRLSVTSQVSDPSTLDEFHSLIKGATMTYLDTEETAEKLDGLVEAVIQPHGVVSLERLGSLAGKDGQSELIARVQKVQQQLDDSIFRDINAWLQPIQQTSKLDANIQARGETTCEWILQNSMFMRWMDAHGGLFWYHGLMGTGKTFTSSFVIQSLLNRDDIYVAYYYFEFTNPITLSEEALHRSLVSQLAPANPTLMRDLHQRHHHGGHQPQIATLQSTLKDLVSTSPKPVFIVIDALDELPPAQRKYLLQSLSAFYNSSGVRAHVMVTSREDRDIRDALDGRVDFQLGVQGDLVRQDIAAYVDQQLAAKKWTLWPRDEVELMRQVLNERADGQFRMVACQVDIIMQARTSDMLLKSLYSLPTTLGNTYEYILNQIRKDLRGSARILFAFLSFASKPVSITELNALVAVDFGNENNSDQLPDLRRANCFHDPLDLLDLGASLVSETTNWEKRRCLQFVHASVKEYLLADSGKWFALQEGPAHNLIASACLAVLLHFHILMGCRDSRNTPFSYSLENWFKHIFPNGPSVLLNQQKALYSTYPWHNFTLRAYHETSLLSSAASLCLLDLLETNLITKVWDGDILGSALVAAAGSSRSSALVLQSCRLLLRHCVDYHKVIGEAFCAASGGKNLEVVKFLAEKWPDINAVGGKYETALQAAAAAEWGNLEVVQFLVEKGADINAMGGKYGTALQAAAAGEWGGLEVVQFLVEKGADVNAVGGEYGTALQAAAQRPRRSLKVVQFLVEKGADVNVVGGVYGTALHAATLTRSLEVVQFLVEKGAYVDAVGGEHGTALLAAAAEKWVGLEAIQLLVEKGADVNAFGGQYGTALQAAAAVRRGNPEVVQFLVEKGADINAVGGKYGTALQAAAAGEWGGLEVVQFLVEKGADVNAVGGKYGTALQAAVQNGRREIVQFLVEKGADVNAVGGEYGSALQAAAAERWGGLEVVQLLVEKGADINAIGGEYGTALQAGVQTRRRDVIHFLVEKGAHVNAVGGEYGTALQAAALIGSLEAVQFLVGKGADVNVVGGKYGTALQAAALTRCRDVVQFLVEKGADVNAMGGKYGTALQAAVVEASEDMAIVQSLVKMGEVVNGVESTCGDVSMARALTGSLEVVQFLVEKGAYVNAVGGEYGTALQALVADEWGELEAIQFLVEKGADVNAVEGKYGTVLQAVAQARHWKVTRSLFIR